MNDTSTRFYLKDYSLNSALEEVLRQTERHLEEQHKLAGSADQRAFAFAAVQIVVVGILLGNSGDSAFEGSEILIVFFLLLSVSLSIFSARPTRVFGSGGTAKSLSAYLEVPSQGYLLRTLIERNDRNITHNDRVLNQSAKVFRGALISSLLAVSILLSDWSNISQAFEVHVG